MKRPKRSWWPRALALWVLWLALVPAQAQPTFDVPTEATTVLLDPYIEYALDPTGRWRPESNQPPPGGWRALSERPQGNRFGYTADSLWYRATLRAPVAMQRLWIVPSRQLDWVEWTVLTPGRPALRGEAGMGALQAGRVPPHRLTTIALQLEAQQPLTVTMRVQTRGSLLVSVELWEPQAWDTRERAVLMWQGIYFGLLAGLLIYNSFLALRLRDAAYGYYVAFGTAVCVTQMASTLFGPNLLWPDKAMLTHDLLRHAGSLAGALSLLFTNSFLRVASFSPRLSRLLKLSSLVWLASLAGHLWLPGAWPNIVLLVLGLWSGPLILVAGLRAWRHRTPAAGYFLLGWSGVVIGSAVRLQAPFGLLPSLPELQVILQIATAAEMLLLSLALADRIITERRARAVAELQRLREQAGREKAQHALEEKSRFMASITHDLQQPLYAMSLATESLARQGAQRPSGQALDQLRSALFSADELLASLAMNVRLDRETLLPEFETFSMQDMLERIDDLFATRAQQAGLRWRVLPSLALVHSDPAMLERMVCNLVSNAMRYTERGGVLLSCRTRRDHLLIQVWDTGAGIPEAEQAAIFEAYRRGSAAQSHDQGLGLGLSIVSRCASLLGVRVGLRSVSGRGSCFALWVPLALAAA